MHKVIMSKINMRFSVLLPVILFISILNIETLNDGIEKYDLYRPLYWNYVDDYMALLAKTRPKYVFKLNNRIRVYNRTSGQITYSDFRLSCLNNTFTYLEIGQKCENLNKMSIVIIGGMLGSDWITISAALDYARRLDIASHIFRNFCFVIFPVVNIDGFDASTKYASLKNWKKNMCNRSEDYAKYFTQDEDCFGVNLLYNQEFRFEKPKLDFCDEFYGHYPESQPESKFLKTVLRKKKKKLFVFIIRQGARLITYPVKYSFVKGSDWMAQESLAKTLAEEAKKVNNRKYDYGHALEFEKGGTTSDWLESHFQTKYVFDFFISTVSDNNALTRQEIRNSCEEFIAAVNYTVTNYYKRFVTRTSDLDTY